MILSSLVWIQYQHVTDRRTDRQTDDFGAELTVVTSSLSSAMAITCLALCAVAHKNTNKKETLTILENTGPINQLLTAKHYTYSQALQRKGHNQTKTQTHKKLKKIINLLSLQEFCTLVFLYRQLSLITF